MRHSLYLKERWSKMLPWYVFSGVAVVGICVYNIAAKSLGGFGPVMATAMLCLFGALAAVLYLGVRFMLGYTATAQWSADPKLWGMFLLGGAGVFVINYGYAEMYARGAPISIGAYTVLIGSLALMTIVGMVLFKEPLTLPKILGLGFAAAALVCFMKG